MSMSKSVRTLTTCGVLLAMDVVITRLLSFNVWNLRIGFSFIAVALAAYYFGPLGGALVHGLSDALGAILFPTGTYFFGFTLSAALIGVLYGVCFRRHCKTVNIAVGVVSAQLLCSVLLNSLSISIVYHSPFWSLLPLRLAQAGVMTVIQLAVLPFLFRRVDALKIIKP